MKTNRQKMHEAMERDGDPDEDFLNSVEKKLILPKIEDLRIKNHVCKKEKEVMEACQKKYGFSLAILCVFDVYFYGHCVSKSRDNEDIKDDCMEEYIAIRSRYRLTKDPEMLKKLKGLVFPNDRESKS